MGRAFDAALALFGEKFQPPVIHEAIARRRRIITAARKGERDPERLRDLAIEAVTGSIRKADQDARLAAAAGKASAGGNPRHCLIGGDRAPPVGIENLRERAGFHAFLSRAVASTASLHPH